MREQAPRIRGKWPLFLVVAFDGSTLWVANDNDGGALATFFPQVAAP